MINSKLRGLLIITILVFKSCSIMFKIASNKPTCLKIPGGQTYVITYVVSGENDRNVKMQVFSNGQSVLRKDSTNDFHQVLKLVPGSTSICFQRMDGIQKVISFDYYKEFDPLREIIDKKDITIALRSLKNAVASLKQVGRNQKFHIQRNEINRTILQKSQNKIKWAGIIKIIFLITSALIQLWIMKSFFNKNSVPYQPVQQH